jgi:hypothetical protein
MKATVKVKCVCCDATHDVKLNEVPADECAMCPLCFSPCVPVEAQIKHDESEGKE